MLILIAIPLILFSNFSFVTAVYGPGETPNMKPPDYDWFQAHVKADPTVDESVNILKRPRRGFSILLGVYQLFV